MRLSILCFALGVWLLQQQRELPGAPLVALVFGACLVLAAATARLHRKHWSKPALACAAALGLCAGFAWAAGAAQLRMADRLPVENEGRDVRIVGVVSDLPQKFDGGLRFELSVEQSEAAVPALVQLSWYAGRRGQEGVPPMLRAGERWQLMVRLKRPHGNLNPHGFDYEAHLLERGVRATGYVRESAYNRRIDDLVRRPMLLVERLRQSVRERFQAALSDRAYAGVIIALVVGDQRAIAPEYWDVFARTGTTHLMSISGLHVTMVAGLLYFLVFAAWRRLPGLCLRLPAQKAAVLGGAGAALLYALLAGFGVPAQRTLYMLTVVALALWLGRIGTPSRVLAVALAAVLIVDPWAVLSAGFWLSFAAVGFLFYIGAGRLAFGHWLREWARSQWAVTIGLIPALLVMFQQLSLVAPLANAVAIPVVSFLITPLALAAAMLPFDALLTLDHQLLTYLMALLEWLSDVPQAVWQQAAPPTWALLSGVAGCTWLLLPRGFPARWVGALLLLPLLLAQAQRPGEGELRMTVLDVGHGLAVHLQTRAHDLLYDTGPRYSPQANAGNRIILPYLRAAGVGRIHGLVVSHEDQDHAGGMAAVLEGLPVEWVTSSIAARGQTSRPGHRPCHAGQSWEWDGVRFDMLHPQPADYLERRKDNDLSCVLRVTAGSRRVLLTGDIEAAAESALLRRLPGPELASEILVVPHHGSRSSSSARFIAAVAPAAAIFPVGYRNAFRHPHPDVAGRYERSGVRALRTDRDGAVAVIINSSGSSFELARQIRRRYWHHTGNTALAATAQ